MFVPGSKMYLADALSRLHLNDTDCQKLHDVFSIRLEDRFAHEIERINMIENLPIADERLQDILKATSNDEDMQQLRELIINGFPENPKILKYELRQFNKYKAELSTQNGLIFKGQRVIVPKVLRSNMLARLHNSHSGIEKTQRLARDSLFWPGVSQDVRDAVEKCKACARNSPNLMKESMMSTVVPSLPFEIVSMDVFELNVPRDGYLQKQYFLATVDHYSDFFEVDEMNNLRSNTVVEICKRNFARHGVPKLVVCDNGTHFKNSEFSKFAMEWEFKILTTSPYHPQRNGKAEATVKIAKNLMKRSLDNGDDVHPTNQM